MRPNSVWIATTPDIPFLPLEADIETEVAIIGGGITGVTLAHLLSRSGKRVVVLEAHSNAGGTTGHSTGNLYSVVGERIYQIESKHGKDTSRAVVESRAEAVALIESLVKQHQFDCEFMRVPWVLYATNEKDSSEVEKERDALRNAGLVVDEVRELPYDVNATIGIRVEGQAQFNPAKYVEQLCKITANDRARFYENSQVVDIQEKEDHVVLRTPRGSVRADQVIHATHTPKGALKIHTSLAPYREYAVAVTLEGPYPDPGIYWSLEPHGKSIRTYETAGEKYVVCLGSVHKTGQEKSAEESYRAIERYLADHFPVSDITHRWSAQGYRSPDLLPFVGKLNNSKRIYFASGFATDGLTYGTLSAMILHDMILGLENRWQPVYSPDRSSLLSSVTSYVKENINVAGQYIKDMPAGEVESVSDIRSGEGKVVVIGGEKCGVYRDSEGGVHAVSAVCTHMACIVEWNDAERSWDCPCHGSRFSPEGVVLEGPAMINLERKILPAQERSSE
jgi:glycine/D-amino acid oxidase-like deaminating enzyme/nitrite reductase/ring-hydroxylating ferredoxin subunit